MRKTKRWGGVGGSSGEDRQLSLLRRAMGNSLPNLGTPSAVNIYCMYLSLNVLTMSDLKL